MNTISWLPEALEDLKRLESFLRDYSEKASKEVLLKIIDSVETLSRFPEKGAPWELDFHFRELVVRFGAKRYVVRYRVFEERVIVVRVHHEREDR